MSVNLANPFQLFKIAFIVSVFENFEEPISKQCKNFEMFKDQKQCWFGGHNITISKLIKNFDVVKLYC